RIEKGLSNTPGAESANVNFATSKATVHYNAAQASLKDLQQAVRDQGYDAILPETATPGRHGHAHHMHGEQQPASHDTAGHDHMHMHGGGGRSQQIKLIVAILLSVPLAVIAMGPHL